MQDTQPPGAYKIRLMTLVALSAAGVFSVANNGALATDGFAVITYLLVAAVGYLLPCVLVAGELGSRIQGSGGIFDWVAAGLGPRWGVAAAGAQWAQNLPFLPYAFAFAAAGLAAIIDPGLISNKVWTFFVMLVFIWGGTLANLFSLKLSSRAITAGFVVGNLLPAAALVVLAALWLLKGQPSALTFTWKGLTPDIDLSQLMIFTGVMLALFGIEVAAPLARRVDNPRRTFPIAMGVSALVIVVGYAVSVVPISIAVPQDKISLEYGTLTAFKTYFDFFGIGWMRPVMAFLLVLGVASVGLVWILTPARTMQAMADHGLIPHAFSVRNGAGMPVGALLIQAVLASLFALPVLFLPTVGAAFFLSLAAAAQLHLIMYLILFAAFIKVKLTDAPPPGVFVIPGGKTFGALISLLGALTCAVAFIVGFIPPTSVLHGSESQLAVYWGVLAASILGFAVVITWIVRKIGAQAPARPGANP